MSGDIIGFNTSIRRFKTLMSNSSDWMPGISNFPVLKTLT